MPHDIAAMYVELLKKTLINEIYIENEMKVFYLVSAVLFGAPVDRRYLIHPERAPGPMPDLIRNEEHRNCDQHAWRARRKSKAGTEMAVYWRKR